jgi:hypothetical protein
MGRSGPAIACGILYTVLAFLSLDPKMGGHFFTLPRSSLEFINSSREAFNTNISDSTS